MTVHVGRITSEVATTLPPSDGDTGDDSGRAHESAWEQRARTAAHLERLRRDRLRTATGGQR